MTKIIVLGAGLVGKPIALDLANELNFEVAVADVNNKQLAGMGDEGVQTIQVDLQNKTELDKLIEPYDFVVNAVPGFMGFECLKIV